MTSITKRREVRFTDKAIKTKQKFGGRTIVSNALVKAGATNLLPKIHVKRGDMVMIITGPKREDKKRSAELTNRLAERNCFRGTVGKVKTVMRKEGKVVIEGVNMATHFVKQKAAYGESGIIRKEEPIFASKVMLYDPEKKKPVRASKRKTLS